MGGDLYREEIQMGMNEAQINIDGVRGKIQR